VLVEPEFFRCVPCVLNACPHEECKGNVAMVAHVVFGGMTICGDCLRAGCWKGIERPR
jgi:hypothetical protein